MPQQYVYASSLWSDKLRQVHGCGVSDLPRHPRATRRSRSPNGCEPFRGLPPFRPLSRAALAFAPLRLRPSKAPRPTRPTSGFGSPLAIRDFRDTEAGSARMSLRLPRVDGREMRSQRRTDRRGSRPLRVRRSKHAGQPDDVRAHRRVRFMFQHDGIVNGHASKARSFPVSDVAYIPHSSRLPARLGRSLHGPHRHVPRPVCLPGIGARPTAHRSPERHGRTPLPLGPRNSVTER